jgi:hypothetical protein
MMGDLPNGDGASSPTAHGAHKPHDESDLRRAQAEIVDETARAAWRRAIHEAAHAVVAIEYGLELESVSLEASGGLLAHTVIAGPIDPHLEIQVLLAGELAETADNGWALPYGRQSAACDDAMVDALLSEMPVPPKRKDEIRAECLAAAQRIVVGRRDAIQAIAAVLIEEGTIDGARAFAIARSRQWR